MMKAMTNQTKKSAPADQGRGKGRADEVAARPRGDWAKHLSEAHLAACYEAARLTQPFDASKGKGAQHE
jgi:hypothetical protein